MFCADFQRSHFPFLISVHLFSCVETTDARSPASLFCDPSTSHDKRSQMPGRLFISFWKVRIRLIVQQKPIGWACAHCFSVTPPSPSAVYHIIYVYKTFTLHFEKWGLSLFPIQLLCSNSKETKKKNNCAVGRRFYFNILITSTCFMLRLLRRISWEHCWVYFPHIPHRKLNMKHLGVHILEYFFFPLHHCFLLCLFDPIGAAFHFLLALKFQPVKASLLVPDIWTLIHAWV